MPHKNLTNDLLLPELKLIKQLKNSKKRWRIFLLEKTSPFEVYPKRFRKHIMWCCQQFMNLKRVAIKYQTPWSKTVGIDDAFFLQR